MKWSRMVPAVVFVCGALTISACGSDDNQNASAGASAGTTASTGTTAGTTSTAAATPAATAVEPPPTAPLTELPITEPLSKAPAKGVDAIFLQCELPICSRYSAGFMAATKALGWKGSVMTFKATAPGAGLTQAIQRKPKFIAITGIPPVYMKAELKAAADAGIAVMSCGAPVKPGPDQFASQCGGTLANDAEQIGRWVINDSGAKANVLAVNIKSYDILNTETAWFKDEFKKLCAACSFDELGVTVDDVGAGKVASQIVAYLQSHPKVNYVYLTFSDLALGVPQALKGAGMADKVKLVGAANDKNIVAGIADGTIAAFTMQAVEMSGWIMVDSMARLSVGDKLSPGYLDSIWVSHVWTLDDPAVAKTTLADAGGVWQGPAGYQEQFAKLWQLGS